MMQMGSPTYTSPGSHRHKSSTGMEPAGRVNFLTSSSTTTTALHASMAGSAAAATSTSTGTDKVEDSSFASLGVYSTHEDSEVSTFMMDLDEDLEGLNTTQPLFPSNWDKDIAAGVQQARTEFMICSSGGTTILPSSGSNLKSSGKKILYKPFERSWK